MRCVNSWQHFGKEKFYQILENSGHTNQGQAINRPDYKLVSVYRKTGVLRNGFHFLRTGGRFAALVMGSRGTRACRDEICLCVMIEPANITIEEKMEKLPQLLFWLGIISIPLAWIIWYMGPNLEILRPVLSNISDPALKAVLQEAHAERLGIWVGIWPVTLLVLSNILEDKTK